MTKQNTEKRDSRASANSTGSNRSENPMGWIPGTKIPKKFYVTIALDMETLLKAGLFKWRGIVENHFKGIMIGALEQLKDFRFRHQVFRYCGSDPGGGFKVEYDYGFMDIDGAFQLLRTDLLPISKRSTDALMDWIDGKLEPDEDGVLRPVDNETPSV